MALTVPALLGWTALLLVLLLLLAAVYRVARSPHPLRLAWVVELNALLCRVWYRTRRIGPCTVPATGPVVIVGNHTCTADPLFVYASCKYRKISFMIAREFSEYRLWGRFVRLAECIPVAREANDVAATKRALRHLKQGGALGIFIEGRIPKPDETPDLKDGAALLALRSGATVIPLHISGTLYRDGILAGFLARHRARIRFGQPLDLSEFAGRNDRESVSAATQRIHAAIHGVARSAV